MDAITLNMALIGAVTEILALLRDRAKVKLSRVPFDERYLRSQRPDLRQSNAVTDIPLDLAHAATGSACARELAVGRARGKWLGLDLMGEG